MKKKILTILIFGVIFLGITGCGKEKIADTYELNIINDKIIEYFEKNGSIKYDNYSYNYVDEENGFVIVGLLDNSKEQQEWFRKNIVNSKYIKFEQAKPLINNEVGVSEKIDIIINNGPQTSSNPYDYIEVSQKEYNELLQYPRETFEYSIKDLIESNANNGLKGYIEALLCKEINRNFEYDFESANDYLEHYKEFLSKNNLNFNQYDEYTQTLLK